MDSLTSGTEVMLAREPAPFLSLTLVDPVRSPFRSSATLALDWSGCASPLWRSNALVCTKHTH